MIGPRRETLSYWIEDYLATKRFRWRPKTLEINTSILKLYLAYVGEGFPPTRKGVLSWLASVAQKRSEATVYTYWTHLKAFFNYLEKVSALEAAQNPVREILALGVAPPKPDLLPAAFPASELLRLLEHLEAEAQTGDRLAIRDLAIILFAYVTGCRSGEIARLRLADLDLKRRQALIRAEGKKSKRHHWVVFDSAVAQVLERWLELHPAPAGGMVFVALGGRAGVGQPVTGGTLLQMLRRRCDEVGIPRRKFHALRHASALDALEAGISVDKVQRQLGHASLATTMVYLRGRLEDRARSYEVGDLSGRLRRKQTD